MKQLLLFPGRRRPARSIRQVVRDRLHGFAVRQSTRALSRKAGRKITAQRQQNEQPQLFAEVS